MYLCILRCNPVHGLVTFTLQFRDTLPANLVIVCPVQIRRENLRQLVLEVRNYHAERDHGHPLRKAEFSLHTPKSCQRQRANGECCDAGKVNPATVGCVKNRGIQHQYHGDAVKPVEECEAELHGGNFEVRECAVFQRRKEYEA